MSKQYAEELLNKYREGTCSPQELAIVESWLLEYFKTSTEVITEEEFFHAEDKILHGIFDVEERPEPGFFKRWLWPAISVAAAIVVVFSIGTYFFKKDTPSTYINDINPGSNKAILTLSDGRKISLTDAKDGALATQSGFEILKTADGQLVYKAGSKRVEAGRTAYNAIETPKGGQYQIFLPDGTKVWLNAASSLKFPSTFLDLGERKVELSGEAYFEVVKDKLHPFLVESKGQEIKVLGTHFNVSSYADDATIKTTLLEGSVKINSSVILKPGQQSVNDGSMISVDQVDIENAVAWKNGEFMFRNESLESIMKKVSRWYDVDVVYQNKQAGQQVFGGTISRFGKVSEVLCMLELTGDVKFKVEGRRIIVMK
eukprot:gene9983-11655_t